MRKMLSKIININKVFCIKTKLNKLKKISTLLNFKNLPNSLLSISKRIFISIIFTSKKISLSLFNFILKDNKLEKLMPNINNKKLIHSYGYQNININDLKQDLNNMKNIVKCMHHTNYNLLVKVY